MAIATYADLKDSIADWMARSDVSGKAADLITLAEARLNRKIPAVETDVALTGTQGSRRIDISAQSCVQPIALFLAETGQDEVLLQQQVDGSFPYKATSGKPTIWAVDGTNIDFDCPLDSAYPFRFRLRQRFALSDIQTTNWLLTNHPDIYLAACLIWGGIYIQDVQQAAVFNEAITSGLDDVVHELAQRNRGTLRVDDALLQPRRFDYVTGV